VVVNDPASMQLAEDRRELERQVESARDVERARRQERREGDAAAVFQDEPRRLRVACDVEGLRNARDRQPRKERHLAARVAVRRADEEDRGPVGGPHGAQDRDRPAGQLGKKSVPLNRHVDSPARGIKTRHDPGRPLAS